MDNETSEWLTLTTTSGVTTNSNGNNSNATDTYTVHGRGDMFVAKVVVQFVIFALAIFGNSCLFIFLRRRKRRFTRMHVFITHLCFADMLVAFFNILPQVIWDIFGEWKAGDFMCKFVKFMQVFVMYLSTYVLVLTALDRRRAICAPLLSHTWTYRLVHLSVAGVYCLSAFLSIPQAIIFKYQETEMGSDNKDCWVHFHPYWTLELYITSFTVLIYIIPLFILIYSYGSIYYTIFIRYKQSKEEVRNTSTHHEVPTNRVVRESGVAMQYLQLVQPHTHRSPKPTHPSKAVPRSHTFSGFTRAKLKTVKLTFVIIMAYVACWSPFFISQLWWLYDEEAPANNKALIIMLLLASLNSCCNPWIYMAFSGTFSCCRVSSKKKYEAGYPAQQSSAQKAHISTNVRGTAKSNSVLTTPLSGFKSFPKHVQNTVL